MRKFSSKFLIFLPFIFFQLSIFEAEMPRSDVWASTGFNIAIALVVYSLVNQVDALINHE